MTVLKRKPLPVPSAPPSHPTLQIHSNYPGKLRPACHTAWLSRTFDWIPVVILPVVCGMFLNQLPAWVFTWLMAFSIFAGCKWVTWRRALRSSVRPSLRRSLGYLFAWPGMDAAAFLNEKTAGMAGQKKLNLFEWGSGFSNILAGGFLIRVAIDMVSFLPEVAGWMTLFGIVLILHFGLFKIVSLLWQTRGVDAPPIMRQPLKAASLEEFWSRRWNVAFTDLVHKLALRPLARRFGLNGGILAVFLISGLVHEAVISLPARGGLGLPTGYFLLQGLGIVLAREGCRWHLNKGIRGRIYSALFTIGPVYWLFHPPFVSNVILPMLGAFGTKGIN